MMQPYDQWHAKFRLQPEEALTVVHIPARMGSSRIARKNAKPLNGLPLLAYSIRMARALPEVDRVYVNTESPELAELARHYGASIPFLRPAHLATTNVPMQHAVQYFYDWLFQQPETVKKVVTFYPTSPFRNRERMRHFIRKMDDCVLSHFVMPVTGSAASGVDWRYLRTENPTRELVSPLRPRGEALQPDPMFKTLGTFIGHSCHTRWGEPHLQNLFLPADPIEAVDLDEPEDWDLAESLLAAGLYDFGMDMYANIS